MGCASAPSPDVTDTVGRDVYPDPPPVNVTPEIGPLILAVAAAPLPPPPVIVIDGCDVKPLPGLLTNILVMTPLVTTAVADAPDPPPPTIEINGEDV